MRKGRSFTIFCERLRRRNRAFFIEEPPFVLSKTEKADRMDKDDKIREEQSAYERGSPQESRGYGGPHAGEERGDAAAGSFKEAYNIQDSGPFPNPEKDFVGSVRWLGTPQKQQEPSYTQYPNSESEPLEAEALRSFFQRSVADIKQTHQDFDHAADFIYDVRFAQLSACAALYPEMADPKIVEAIIGDELKQLVHDCAQRQKNPAEVLYTIAQKIGYRRAQKMPDPDNVQERHNSARTLAAYNGASSKGPISLEMLDKMSEAEFGLWVNDPQNKAAFNYLMGGGDR